ncbi:MAG: hypothetical protein D3917_06310 [Candidatus Electrothrix sp. AX5]|nr:hypothetical protein [Candidatus Electrothrix sp. AX5]
MKFDLLRNPKIPGEKKDSDRRMITFTRHEGRAICYHQPIYEEALIKLQKSIHDSISSSSLAGGVYLIETNKGYISETYPAVEYYKIAFRMIRDNLHTISISKQEVYKTINRIQSIYRDNSEVLQTGQRRISFSSEIYKLRSDLFTYILSTRAVLDTFSTLIETIYGPNSGRYQQFTSLIKQLEKENGRFKDNNLKKYFDENLEWFYLLKDVRDYLVH